MSDYPYISVVMPVYNAGKFLSEAIQSILDQSYASFEFIIINDGSTDNSLEIIKSFIDKRIKILSNPANIGNYPSRNKGMSIAKGKYIFVMDADDVALKQRLERQYIFMEENPDIGLAGSGFRYFGKEGDIFRESNYERIKVILLFNNCFIHPTLILRNDFLKKFNLQYNIKYYYSADYDLIVRAARHFHITNIPEVLLHYRFHEQQITVQKRAKQMEYADEIAIEQLRYLGIEPDKTEINLHNDLLKGKIIEYSKKLKLYEWINKIKKANQRKKFFRKDELDSFFISLLSRQSLCLETEGISYKIKISEDNEIIDLTDVTFLVPLRIDSQKRKENIETLIKYTFQHFRTKFIILEADSVRRYFPEVNLEGLRYDYVEDSDEVFHRTKWLNILINTSDTPIIGVWDADSIAPPDHIADAISKIRTNEAVLSLPYDGRFYSCDRISCDLFKKLLNIEILLKRVPVMRLMHGYHSVGGAFVVNKEKYLAAGGENENFYGWGPEDTERIKRLEMLDLPIYYSPGTLFHLWHPIGKNSWFSNDELERNNRKELQRTCNLLLK